MLLRKCLLWLIVLCGTALSLPARAAPPLSVYGQLPGFEMAALSSSGDHVALIGRTGEERRLLVYDKDRKLVLSAPLDNAKVRGLNWAGDQFVLVTISSAEKLQVWFTTDKAELGTMLVVDLASGRHWNVFEKDPRVTGGVQGFFGVSERNGRWYGYFSAITYEFDGVATYLQSTAPELFEVDLQSNKAHLIARKNERGMQRWLVGNDGQVSARMEYYTFGGTWKIRNSAGEQIAIGVSKLGGIDLSGFGPSGASVIHRVTDDDDNSDHWFEAPLAGGAGTEILKGVAVNRLLFDKRTRQCVGYQLDGDQPSYKFYNARQQRIVDATIKAFPGLSVNLVDWSNAFDKLLVRTEGSGDPGTWWLVDIKTGNADQLGKSYALRSADVAPVTMIQYKAGDGMDIAAALTLPPGRTAKNLPVIVFAHGGPAQRIYPGFDWWAQAFASRGYAVLQPNFRGSSGYGAAFEKAGHGQWGKAMQTDLSDGITHLAKQGMIDPKRVCIMGGGYGGYAALAGVSVQQGLYRCAVSVAGIGDVAEMIRKMVDQTNFDPWIRRALKAEVGASTDMRAVSPINFVDRTDAPVLLIHGKDDTVVEYDQSRDMASALKAAGKPVEFVTLAGEDHWLSRSDTRLAMLEAAVAFIEKHNPPDPAK